MSSKLQIEIKKFRSVESADIKIDGITLVAGENGSGKSTISKILYYLFKTVGNFEDLVIKDLNFKLRNIHRYFDYYMDDVLFDLDKQIHTENFESFIELRDLFQSLSSINSVEDGQKKWNIFFSEFKKIYFESIDQNRFEDNYSDKGNWHSRRIRLIAQDLFSSDSDINNQQSLLFELENKTQNYFSTPCLYG